MNKVTVNVCVLESKQPLQYVKVALFDHDRRSADDPLGVVTTDGQGQAHFQYDWQDFRDGWLGDDGALFDYTPELYAVAYGENGSSVFRSKPSTRPTQTLKLAIPREIALQNGLLQRKQRPSTEQKMNDWVNSWRDYINARPGPQPETDLCVMRLAFQMLTGLNNPTNELEERVRKLLDGRFDPDYYDKISEHAQKGRVLVEQAAEKWGVQTAACDNTPEALAEKMLKPGGLLNPLVHYFGGDTALFENLPTPEAGLPFTREPIFDKYCSVNYNQTDPQDRAAIFPEMHAIIENGVQVLVSPSVNHIKVYEGEGTALKREADVQARKLTLYEIGYRDEQVQPISEILEMNVPVTATTAVILKEDPVNQNQILATDVEAGQHIALWGSGFINEKATLRVRHMAWAGQPSPQGLLIPQATSFPVPGFSNEEVVVFNFGDSTLPANATPETYIDNLITFEWPVAANQPGLYEVTLEFENTTPHLSTLVQDPSNCDVSSNIDPVQSQTLYFMRLPDQLPSSIKVRATNIECIDETNPESLLFVNLFDDISFITQGSVERFNIDPANLANSTLTPLITSDIVSRSFSFWSDGQSEMFNQPILPNDLVNSQLLNEFDILTLALQAAEVEGIVDRTLLTILFLVVIAAIIVIVLAICVAAILIIALTFGLGATIVVALIGLVGSVFGAMFGAFGTVIIGAIVALFAVQPAGLLVAAATPQFMGQQLQRMFSPYRFHQLLYPPPATMTQVTPGGMNIERTFTLGNGQLVERTRCNVPGSIYALTLTLDLLS